MNARLPRLTRRRMLATSAAAVGMWPAFAAVGKEPTLRIDRIQAFPCRYPLTGYFKFLARGRGTGGRAAVIVKIIADGRNRELCRS